MYGFEVRGLPGALDYMNSSWAGAPVIEVAQTMLPIAPEIRAIMLTTERATLPLSDGSGLVELGRDLRARLTASRRHPDEALLHPFLTGTFAVSSWWLGFDGFHAGAFVVDGRAWAVIGAKGQGKSTLMAFLARDGIPVLADDLAVIIGEAVQAGPRFVDLRPDAAAHLGGARDLGIVGARPRARIDIAQAMSSAPLAGWVMLDWGDDVALSRVPADRLLPALLDNRAVMRDPADPAAFLTYATRPAFRLTRPREWSALPRVRDALLAGVR